MTKRKEISFNEVGYNHELKQYSHKKAIEGMILKEFNKIGVKEVNYNNDILKSFYSKIAEIHESNNTLKLSPIKLCDLLEIDDSLIKNHCLQYKNFKDIKKPRRDPFCVYAETDEELYKLEFANKLIDILNELKEHRNIQRMDIIRLFGSIIKLDNSYYKYIVNPTFIKN